MKLITILGSVLASTVVVQGQIVALASSISTAWNSVQGILSAFKTTSKDTLLQTMTNQGYQTFMDKTTVDLSLDIPEIYWKTFVGHMSTNLYVPSDQLQMFQNYIMDAQYIGSEQWSAMDMTFSSAAGATCNYILVSTAKNYANNTRSWAHANVQAAFTLMPNIMVISHEKSSFFSDKVTLELRKIPAGLQLSDFEPIFAFLRVIGLKQLGSLINLDLPLK